jgi:hypothetical protein
MMVSDVPLLSVKVRRVDMDTVFGFAALVMATILGLFSALALQAVLLRATFALMQPATADRRPLRPPIERGTQLTVRAYARTH